MGRGCCFCGLGDLVQVDVEREGEGTMGLG